VSPGFLILPHEWGQGGLQASMEAVPAGFVSIYPLYNWIPACAGMTEEGARDLSLPGGWGCPQFSYFPP
jgi:hypothetical protein